MSEVKTYYCYCDDHCKYATFTAEQIVGLLEYVIENNALPSDLIVDGTIDSSAQISAVNSIIEQNHNKSLKIWVGTQAEYDAYTGDKTNLFAIVSDDNTKEEILTALNQNTNNIDKILDGTLPVSVKKSDGTMKQITEDANNIMKYDGTTIPRLKTIWSGDTTCAKDTETDIQLDESISMMDTLVIEWMFSVTSLRPVSNVVVVGSKNIRFSVPVMYVHLLGFERLDVYSKDYNSLTFGGSVGTSSDYNASIRVTRISKVIQEPSFVLS